MNYVVTKEGGLFVMRECDSAGRRANAVQAFDAQMIVDYANATLPVGTVIEWDIRPNAKGRVYRREDFLPVNLCAQNRSAARLAGGDRIDLVHSSARAYDKNETGNGRKGEPATSPTRPFAQSPLLRFSLFCLGAAIVFRLVFEFFTT